MSTANEEKFVIKHIFTDFKSARKILKFEKEEEYFGFTWKISIRTIGTLVFVYLECLNPHENWSIESEITTNILETKFKNTEFKIFFSRQNEENLYYNCTPPDVLTVEVTVKIWKINKIPLKKTKNFDESNKEFSDVVLKIDDKKFYVLKHFLASDSAYFESLFFGNFVESKQSEVELKDIEPQDFQNFLEIVYGESVVDDSTVEEILHLADFFDSKIAIKACQDFLVSKSEKSLKFKFHVAVQYKLEELKKQCFGQMNTKNDVISCASEDNGQYDKDVWKELFHKLASFS